MIPKRKHIKNFYSCEFVPALEPLELKDGVETPVWLLIPFPPLHTVILGPVNHLEKSLMNLCEKEYVGDGCVWASLNREDPENNPLLKYERELSLIKTDYHGKQFEGNQCKTFMKEKNLDKVKKYLIEDNMPEDLVDIFMEAFSNIRQVYSSCCGKKLDPNHRIVTENLEKSWSALVEDSRVKLTWPNKIHQIVHHFSDYFEDPLCSGEALGTTTDQVIEHMHSYVDKALRKSGYWINDRNSELCAQKQHEGILQINAFSVNVK